MVTITVRFSSWQLTANEVVELQKLLVEFLGANHNGARRQLVDALFSGFPVCMRVHSEREAEFSEKMRELGAHISN